MYPYCNLSFFNLLGTRDIPPFGSAENASMGRERNLGVLVYHFFKFWHERRQVFAGLNVSGSSHGLQGGFLFSEAGQMTYYPLRLQLQNNLCSYGPGEWPWIGGLF